MTASVWNARKLMVDWLRAYYPHDNEVVDLFYAITHCHGWVRNSVDAVTVRLEPLQQPKRRAAQEQFCRKLTALGAQTPLGKGLSSKWANPRTSSLSDLGVGLGLAICQGKK